MKTYSILSGRLAATFNIDGGHLNRYLRRAHQVRSALCEELILHDYVYVPIPDYLTACGLVRILGERGLIRLLESERLTLVRSRGLFGYVRGTGPEGGILGFEDPKQRRPQDCDVERAVRLGLDVIAGELAKRSHLEELLVQRTIPVETTAVVGAIWPDAYADLKGSSLWRPEYEFDGPGLLRLPGLEDMQVRMIGPGANPARDPVDALLALINYNIELYLAQKFGCDTVSSASPLGDLCEIKARRLTGDSLALDRLVSLLEIDGVPDLGLCDLVNTRTWEEFLELSCGDDATQFRSWFHGGLKLSETEFLQDYVRLLRTLPLVQRLPAKILRFAVTTGLGFLPVVGQVAGAIDTFIVDKVLRGRSPRFFLDDLRSFTGRVAVARGEGRPI